MRTARLRPPLGQARPQTAHAGRRPGFIAWRRL